MAALNAVPDSAAKRDPTNPSTVGNMAAKPTPSENTPSAARGTLRVVSSRAAPARAIARQV